MRLGPGVGLLLFENVLSVILLFWSEVERAIQVVKEVLVECTGFLLQKVSEQGFLVLKKELVELLRVEFAIKEELWGELVEGVDHVGALLLLFEHFVMVSLDFSKVDHSSIGE